MFLGRLTLAATAALLVACADPVRLTEIPLELAEARATSGISIIDLGSISADGASYARDVNATGVIVGYDFTQKYEPGQYTHAMRWSVNEAGVVVREDLMSLLKLPSIADAQALAVNDAGTTVGIMRTSDAENFHGFILSASGAVSDVSTFPRCDGAFDETNSSYVRDINNHGEIVGQKVYFRTGSSATGYSFYLDLGAAAPCVVQLPGMVTAGSAYAINDSSVIIGESYDGTASWAVRWRRTSGTWEVSKLGRASTRAWSINLRGDVAGQFAASTSGIDQRALVWMNSAGMLVEKELGTLGGATQSVASGIDDSGRVVGWAHNRQLYMRAFDWTETTGMRDLGTLGGKLASANSVNGKLIVGYSELATPGRAIITHATLWRIP